MALAHFFQNYFDVDHPFDSHLLNQFFSTAMTFEYWQKNNVELGKEFRSQLESFVRHCKIDLHWEEILFPDQVQIVQIGQAREFRRIIERADESMANVQETKFVDRSDGLVQLDLLVDGAVNVHQHSDLAYLRDGKLFPLPAPMLSYSPDLELIPGKTQFLRLDRFSHCQFRLTELGMKATVTKGYSFRQDDKISGGDIEETPKIFNALKRLEKNYIDCKSDPFYQNLTQRLEKAAELLQIDPKRHLETALGVYEQGRLVVEEIFTDDKLLQLLIKDLGHHLVHAWQEKKQAQSQDRFQKRSGEAEWPVEAQKIRPHQEIL